MLRRACGLNETALRTACLGGAPAPVKSRALPCVLTHASGSDAMKIRSLVLIAALAACGQALAQYDLPTVEVRGSTYSDDHAALSFACGNLREPSAAEAEGLLKVGERSQSAKLSKELMGVV